MRWLQIEKSNFLKGKIKVPGSKNSALGLLAACCVGDEPLILNNIPNISDVRVIFEIAKDIGLRIKKENQVLYIDPCNINTGELDLVKSSSYRAAYYFVGALLQKFKKVSIGYPGGDNFGSRPIDQHVKGLKAMGAKFTFHKEYYVVEAEKLKGADIYFDVITCGATINVMLAAVRAEGKTILRNAAVDPEVVDVAILLNKMGANIKGAGTGTITIEGVNKLHGCTHSCIPDRLIAGAFLMTAGITGGNITVEDIIPEHIESCVSKLIEAGVDVQINENSITASRERALKGIKVETAMYPGFGSDYQQPLTSMLVCSEEHSTVIEKIYPNRFNHCIELNKMGADIVIQEGRAIIPGRRKLKGAWVHASDIRAGISLILAGLVAEGITNITGVEHIERGYEDIVSVFTLLGANIKIQEDSTIEGEIGCNVC